MLLETLSVKLQGDTSDFVAKMNSAASAVTAVGERMQAAGQRMQAMGLAWSVAVTMPLIALGKSALDSAADFEVSMNVIEQVTNATTEQMAAMSKQALKLGRDTVFSANEAAEAQLELSKAGMAVNDVLVAMPGVLDLAAAGDVDLATAAKLTASVLNAFSLEAKESTRVANLLAAAANASAADIGDLALGFAQGSFAFAAAGQKVDDLAASLAILTNVGLKGTDAGTALKNMFTQLYGPTQKAKDAMAAYNIDIFDASGNMIPLVDIIDIFNTQLGGLSQEQRLAALETILLSDGMKAMIPLMNAGKDGFLAMKDAVNEEGAAAAVANARMKGLAGAIEYFKGTIDTLMVETATPWLAQLSEIIRKTADWIAKFGELDPVIQKNVIIFLALAAAAGPVLLYAGMLISIVGSLISVFSIFLNPLVAIGLALLALILPTDKIGRAFESMRFVALKALKLMYAGIMSALDAIENMFGVNLSGIRHMVESAYGLIQRIIQVGFFRVISDLVRSRLTEWKQKFFEMSRVVMQWSLDFGRYIRAILTTGDYLNDWLVHLPEPIRSMARAFGWGLSLARDAFLRLVAYVRSLTPGWIETLKSWAAAAWQWIVDMAPVAIAKLQEWGGLLWAWVTDHLPEWGARLAAWAAAAWQWIVDMAPVAIAKLQEWAAFLYDYIKNALPGWLAVLGEWRRALVAWIVEALPAALEDLKYFVSLIYNNLKNSLTALWPMLIETGKILWQWIVETTPAVIAELQNLLNAISVYVQQHLPEWKARLAAWANAIWQWIVEMTPVAIQKLGEWGNAIWAWVTDHLPEWKARLAAWATAAWQWITDEAMPMVSLKLGEMWAMVDQWIRDNVPSLGPWLDEFEGFASGAKKGFDEAFPAMAEKFKNFAKTITDEAPKLAGAFGHLWSAVFGGGAGEDPASAGRKFANNFMNFLGLIATTIGTIISQVRILIDGLAYAVDAVKAFLSGDWGKYAEASHQFIVKMGEFGQVTGAQFQQFLDFMDKWEESARQSNPDVPAAAGPYLGGQASGGWVGRGGRYLVGEMGPEMVTLPAGAYVHSNREASKMGGITITLNQVFSGSVDRGTVASGAQNGILAGLRQVGLA